MARGRNAAWICAAVLVAATVVSGKTPARAETESDAPDSFVKVLEDAQTSAYLETLSAAGHSATGKLYVFRLTTASDSDVARPAVTIHTVQDRGLPRGEEYPTYVFRVSNSSFNPELIHSAHTGTRIYVLDSPEGAGCLVSAQKGYSDVCLADVNGKAAPDLPGLRKDFWTDLIKLFGL